MKHITMRGAPRSTPWLALALLSVASCRVGSGAEARPPEPDTWSVAPRRARALPPAPATTASTAAAPESEPPHVLGQGRALDSVELERAFVQTVNGWSKKSLCPDVDYFPEGGYQTLYCHRPVGLTLRALAGAAGVPIFLSGPHAANDDTLALEEEKDFGHYNPAFVKWFADSVLPRGPRSSTVRLTQREYDVAMRPLVTAFHRTHEKIRADPVCFERERNTYKGLLDEERLPVGYHNRWFYFMEPSFCVRMGQGLTDLGYFEHHGTITGINGNVAMTVVGFFVRRSLDGTMPDFERALDEVVRAYQPELTEPHFGPRPPSAPRSGESRNTD